MISIEDRLTVINVREWYMITYPYDTLGADIDPNITLWEFYEAVKNNKDFYMFTQRKHRSL